MNSFNFNSAICTSRSQSEKLLALGLKKETADMCYQIAYWDCGLLKECSPSLIPHNIIDGDRFIPAWSLHRLIEMCDVVVHVFKKRISLSSGECFSAEETLYGNLINCIEWLIKEGYFNKEYYENGNC